MPIRLLILSLLVLCLAVSGCQQTQEPAVKVGVVDMNRLLRDSEPGKEASRFLEGMQKEIQQQIDDVQAWAKTPRTKTCSVNCRPSTWAASSASMPNSRTWSASCWT